MKTITTLWITGTGNGRGKPRLLFSVPNPAVYASHLLYPMGRRQFWLHLWLPTSGECLLSIITTHLLYLKTLLGMDL